MRIRTVKPSFMRHEELQELEVNNPESYIMLTFIGVWMLCDSKGRFEYRPKFMKLDILPFIPFDISRTLSILENNDFFIRYNVDGKEYGFVPSFLEHQRIQGKEATDGEKYPECQMVNNLIQEGNNWETTEKQLRSQEGKGRERELGKEYCGESSDSLEPSNEMDISIEEEKHKKEKSSAEKEKENKPSGHEASAPLLQNQTNNSSDELKVLKRIEKFESVVIAVFDKSEIKHYSDEYKSTWIALCKSPKWKKKTTHAFELSIKQLSRFDEPFGIDLMEKAISGNYQGVVFDNTDDKYQKYLNNKTLSVVHNGITKFNSNNTTSREKRQQSVDELRAEARRVLSRGSA